VRTDVVRMKAASRRHRTSATPIGVTRIIRPYEIDERYIDVLQLLEPYHRFKYLTIPWLHYLSAIPVEYSVFRKYLGYLRTDPNHYIKCPEQQIASPNVPYKTLVFELAEKGLTLLRDRGLAPEPIQSKTDGTKKKRSKSFAEHRAHSYYHEIIVDLGYYAPLHHLIRNDPTLRLIDFARLRTHENVPHTTRVAADPVLVHLKQAQMRFDGTPHVLVKSRHDGVRVAIGIPGIQIDRGTETFESLEKHLRHAVEYVSDRHDAKLWGFDNCVIPFLFTIVSRKTRAMAFLSELRSSCPYILFKTIPDLGLLHHFPKPDHYDSGREHQADEWVPPPDIHVFTTGWQRVGYPDFFLNTFDEIGAS
jgi:hypothetical protein